MRPRRAGIHAAPGAGVGSGAPRARRLARLERGQTVESVLVYPVVLGLILLMVQVGLWAYARNLAFHSAHEGARAAAEYHSQESGTAAANAVVGRSSRGLFQGVTASEVRDEDSVTVTVSGRAMSLIPLIQLPRVEQSATVPIERYVPADGQGAQPVTSSSQAVPQ